MNQQHHEREWLEGRKEQKELQQKLLDHEEKMRQLREKRNESAKR